MKQDYDYNIPKSTMTLAQLVMDFKTRDPDFILLEKKNESQEK